jgi:hypothetical protein
MTQTVICMKWGTRYGPEYVNRIYSMVRRHTKRPTRVVCYTDDASGLDAGVEAFPLPHIVLPADKEWLPWRKLCVWQKDLQGVSGDVLFLDLDTVVTGSLDEFFDYEPGHFCVAVNWTQRGAGIGNTSVFRFPVGVHTYIYDRIMNECGDVLKKHRNEQIFISREITDMKFWPEEWCLSFKASLIPWWPLNFFLTPPLPASAKVVAFPGKPDPDEAVDGVWPRKHWWQALYKHVRPTPWIAQHWR